VERSWIIRFLRWFCPPQLLEEIEGDLHERFGRDLQAFGEQKAKRRLLWNVVRYLRFGIILRHNEFNSTSTFGIYISYTKSTYRVLKRQPVYTSFNILSLTLGICVFLWSLISIYKEWSYDKHYRDSDSIYRVTMSWKSESDLNETELGWSLSALPEQLRASFVDIETATGLSKIKDRVIVEVGDKSFLEEGYYQTDTCYFSIFNHSWEEGGLTKIDRSSVVLTNSISKKYFGDDSALGKIIEIDQEVYKVVGVVKDVPANSSFRFKALTFTFNDYNSDWGFTFFKIRPGGNVAKIETEIKSLFKQEYSEILQKSATVGAYHIESLNYIHMGDYKMMDSPKANINMLLVLTTLSGIILFISLSNYSNLTTSLAEQRRRESNIRMTLGAAPNNILIQSVFEATWLSISALIISAIVIYSLWPVVDEFNLRDYAFDSKHILFTVLTTILGVLIISYLSGYWSYTKRIKNSTFIPSSKSNAQKFTKWFDGVQVTFQFCIALSLIFSSQIILEQVQEIYGFQTRSNPKQSIIVDIPQEEELLPVIQNFSSLLQHQSNVNQTAFAGVGALPSVDPLMDIFNVNSDGAGSIQTLKYTHVDSHYFKLLNLEIIAGRGFTENEIGSWDAVIVSDSYVRQQGWKDDPLQHKICYGGACEGVPVIGVVRDASFWGLQKSERPMLYYPLYGIPQKMIIRLTSIDDVKVEEIKSLWQKTVQRPFEFQLLDQYLAKHLTKERKMVKQISWLSAIAVLLIIMALLGMIHVQLIRNKKSTAVRKVFGARITDLLRLTWRSHLLLFLIACVFAYPLVHTIMQYWLEQFTLKTTISLMTFIKSIIPLVIIIFFAMLYHSWKLGRMKPLDTIRYE